MTYSELGFSGSVKKKTCNCVGSSFSLNYFINMTLTGPLSLAFFYPPLFYWEGLVRHLPLKEKSESFVLLHQCPTLISPVTFSS
jgi:hypothetical protein